MATMLNERRRTQYEFLSWERALPYIKGRWKQGEHWAIVGPTGSGKTTFESRILEARDYVVVCITKVYDTTLRDFSDYDIITKWPPKNYQNRVLLWPKSGKTIRETKAIQHKVFKEALDRIFKERNWCVVFDEQHYMANDLRLETENAMFLHQGRSSGLSVVNGTQRPAWVPVVTYSSATHAAIWKTTHRDDLRRLAQLGGIDSKQLEYNILQLGKHEFIYVNTRTGEVLRSQVNLGGK